MRMKFFVTKGKCVVTEFEGSGSQFDWLRKLGYILEPKKK